MDDHTRSRTTLEQALAAWARRLGWRRGMARAGRLLLFGAAFVSLFVAVAAWVPVPSGPFESPRMIAALFGALTLGAALAPLITTRFTPTEAAQIADLALGTQALMTTAQDIAHRQAQGDAITDAELACLQRAAAQATDARPDQIAPLNFGARWLFLALPLMTAAAVAVAPFAVDTHAIEEARRLEAAADALKKMDDKALRGDEEASKALRKGLRRLRQRLTRGDLTTRQAMEEIAALQRQLRAEQLRRVERANQAAKAAQAAARELGRAQQTASVGQRMAQGTRSRASQQERSDAAQKAADALRQLKALNRDERRAAAESLRAAAQAAQAAGDAPLADALSKAAEALERGDDESLQRAAAQLNQALRQGQQQLGEGSEDLQQMAQSLQDAQQQLSQGDANFEDQWAQMQAQGMRTDDSDISPEPRQWQPGDNGPAQGSQGNGNAGAGSDHQAEETPERETTGGHQDSNRFNEHNTPDQEVEYQELYEEHRLGVEDRIGTRVKGDMGDSGKVQTMRGGQQAPRPEDARRLMQDLPVRYAREADEAINDETIPPTYRDAVRDYFDR